MLAINDICKPGWIVLSDVMAFLEEHNACKVRNGHRENMTDGEAHWICLSAAGDIFEIKANYYVASSWRPLLNWAENVSAN